MLPTASALRAAAVHQAAGAALSAVSTTGIEQGVYRLRSHAAMNRHAGEALVHALAMNSRQLGARKEMAELPKLARPASVDDLKLLLRALNAHDADDLLMGGYAP
jgi:hypothetical protein